MPKHPRSPQEIEAAIAEARARGEQPRVRPDEVDSLLDVVLERTREGAARASRDLAAAARSISRSSSSGLRRVGT